MAQFEDLLKETNLPEAAVKPIRDKFMEAFNLISENNKRVAQVNAAKAQDPAKPGYSDYLDDLWRSHAKDPKISETVEKFDAISEQYEKLLKELRETAKSNFIPEQLSEDATKETRKLVNESSEAISTAIEQAKAMTAIIDSMLAVTGKTIEGGVISLLPQVDSLKNTRGRKASGGNSGASYMTRVDDVWIDGVTTQIDGKGKFTYAADKLSELWGSDTFAENKVTGTELEEAFFAKLEIPFRSKRSTEVPESTTFDFVKDVKTADDKSETRTVSITVKRYTPPTSAEKVETSKAETPEPAKAKTEPMKIDTRTEPQKAAAAKQTAAKQTTK